MTSTRRPGRTHPSDLPAAQGLGVALLLMVLAMAVPAVTGWNVRVNSFPPLHAEWDPRVGVGTAPAVLLAVLGSLRAVTMAELLPWRGLLAWTFPAGLA